MYVRDYFNVNFIIYCVNIYVRIKFVDSVVYIFFDKLGIECVSESGIGNKYSILSKKSWLRK